MDDVAAGAPIGYAHRLATVLAQEPALGGAGIWLTGLYLHGSAALGGWNQTRSDVDLLIVVSQWSPIHAKAVTSALVSLADDCPGRGVECTVVSAAAARRPEPPWPFLLHLNTSTGSDAARVVDGRSTVGDPDLAMHYTVVRAGGITIAGEPAEVAVGEVPREVVLRYLHDELEWGLKHGTEAYAVLNALRADAFARDGRVVSKVSAGVEALDRGDVPQSLVRRALAVQTGEADPVEPGAEAAMVVRQVQQLLRTTPGPVVGGVW